MKLIVIPKKEITITTRKSIEKILESLQETFLSRNRNVKFVNDSNSFFIKRTINNSSRSLIIAKGTIYEGVENNFIRLTVSAKDSYLKYFTLFWYSINALIFFYFVYSSVINAELHISMLMPLAFILFGYGISTQLLKEVIDQVIKDVIKASIAEV